MTTVRTPAVAGPLKPVAEPELKFEDVTAASPGWTAPAAQFCPKDQNEFPALALKTAQVRPLPGPPSAAPALAFVLARAAGARDSAQLLRQLPGLTDALATFAPRAQGATPADQEKVAFAALRHFAVKTGRPLPPALQLALGGSTEAIASAYARDLGFTGVQRQGNQWQLMGAKDSPVALKAPSGSLAELGEAINNVRFVTGAATLPLGPVDITKPAFGADEAQLAIHLATLAYQPKEVVKSQLEAWGYDMSTFKWIDNKASDTQAFVVADRKGNVFPVFRGTASARDAMTDGLAIMGGPSWKGNTDLKTHAGFTQALDSVWPEMKAGIEQAQRKAGPNAKLMFAGHSLGGALTQLAAVRAGMEGVIKPENVSIYTNGSPRIGNQAFKDKLESLFPKTFRIANYEEGYVDRQDLVTQVPPKSLGFRHAGQMIRLGTDTLKVLESSSAAAGLSEPWDDDPVNAELENLRGPELSRRMQELMGEATVVAPSATDESAANGFQVASLFAHSSGVYLNRIANHATEGR